MKRDFLICGAGLAGCLLAWELSKQNKSFLIVDDLSQTGSSQIAAGIINPISGKRFVLIEDFEELIECAKSLYQELENSLENTFFETTAIIRIFKSAKEHQFWNEERAHARQLSHLKQFNPGGVYQDCVTDPFGSLTFEGYHVHSAELIQALRARFNNHLLNRALHHQDLEINDHHVSWHRDEFDHVVFCEGYQGADNLFFDWIPFKSAKGEILIIETEEKAQPKGILNFGKWMQPLGNGRWKVGATFQWEAINNEPSEIGLSELTQALDTYCANPYKIVGHLAGVRPVVRDLKPLLGTHPQHRRLSIFNGLGAKGYLYAPTYVKILTDHLIKNKELPASVSVTRFME